MRQLTGDMYVCIHSTHRNSHTDVCRSTVNAPIVVAPPRVAPGFHGRAPAHRPAAQERVLKSYTDLDMPSGPNSLY